MKTLNKVQLIGRAGGEPQLKYTQSGKAVAQLSLATDNYAGKDEQGSAQTSTEWHTLVLWERLAETATSYVQKGQLVYVEGRLRTHSWEDETGTKRSRTAVVVDDLILLGGNKPPAVAVVAEEEYADEPAVQQPLPVVQLTAVQQTRRSQPNHSNPAAPKSAGGGRRNAAPVVDEDDLPF